MDLSILEDIKKLIGIDKNYTTYDTDIIMHINSVIAILIELGIGTNDGFYITGYDEKWSDYITEINLNSVKTYIYLKVKILFDPPSSHVMQSYENIIKEIEWRLTVQVSENKLAEEV